MSNEEQLKYPIGKFTPGENYTSEELEGYIKKIEAIPGKIEALASKLSPKQMEASYREGGWTARQVIHHIADSHMNAYIRFKWTLTEDSPTIKAYNEKLWAETTEIAIDPFISINLLKALHVKLVALLRTIPVKDMKKYFTHPETGKQFTLERMIALYAWHGEHHLGHLEIISKK